MKPIVYFSLDIEADGPSPAHNNMLSIGIYGFDTKGNTLLEWEKNLLPLPDKKADPETMEFWKENIEAWKYLMRNREDSYIVFRELANILLEFRDYKIIWIAQPAAYDWQWLNYYYHYTGSNKTAPLAFKAICISSVWQFYIEHKDLSKSEADSLWDKITPTQYSNNHTALMDAKVQGLRYYNFLKEIR